MARDRERFVVVPADADTFDDAIDDVLNARREYAEDWNERLHAVPHHGQHRSLVELVEFSDDDQVRNWLLAAVSP